MRARSCLPALLVLLEGGYALAAGPAESVLLRPREWPAGTIQEQLDRDPTLVPFGKGAVFVPAMTNPLDEPTVTVASPQHVVAEGTTGARIVLVPGTYEVRVGSGTEQQRMRLQATVREGQTAVLPVPWAGLAIHVVDEQLGSLRGSYELIRVEDREYVGLGFGTDEQAGEPVTTWILRPGLYKIVRVGESYRARRDFATVRLQESQLTHFLLVLDKDTGDFKGGGEIPEAEVFRPRGGLSGSLILGGDASLNSRSKVLGQSDGLGFVTHGFADGRLGAEIAGSPLLFRLQLEEGQTKNPDEPWQKSTDILKVDGLYIYQLAPWIGPYVRVGAETNLLAGYTPVDASTRIGSDVVPNLPVLDDGTPIARQSDGRVKLSGPLGLSTLKEGAGLHLRLLKTTFAETTLRTGLGARNRITRDLIEKTDVVRTVTSSTGVPRRTETVFRRVPSFNQIGVEATLLASASLTRWVMLNLELDSLFPFESLEEVLLDFTGSVALKLTSYLSLNYRMVVKLDPTLTDPSVDQQVLLRVSLEIL